MLKRILMPTMLGLLAYGFWLSPNFKMIAAGVAIFLFGMLSLEDGFRAFTGGLLERVLQRTTDTLPKSIGFGFATTTVMQSSSLVSVITISFLSAGLLGLASGIGIILGANIGTTTGAWLIAGLGLKVKLSTYAMPMLVFGIILVFQKHRLLKGAGYVLAGLGFLFLGIHYMKDGFEAYRATIDLASYAIPGFLGLLIFTLIGVAATVIMQSSHATLVLIITALASAQITYENALALAIGANIGTTITALIGAMSANHDGKRLAGAHLIFNLMTGLVAMVFIGQFVYVVDALSAVLGIAPDNHTLKLAVFHTLFNLVGVLLMVPFVGRLVRFLERVIKAPTPDISQPRYLSEAVMDFPETLLEAVGNEVFHLYDNALEVLAHALSLHRAEICSERPLSQVIAGSREPIEFDLDARYLSRIKVLYAAILSFTSRAQPELSSASVHELLRMREACRATVAAVKSIKHLRKNVTLNLNSDNAVLRGLYDTFRLQIAAVLRDLDALRRGDPETDIFDLDAHRALLAENNLAGEGIFDAVLQDGALSMTMITSLMNDQIYVHDVIGRLVEFGTLMHAAEDAVERSLEEAMALGDEDLSFMADHSASTGAKGTRPYGPQ